MLSMQTRLLAQSCAVGGRLRVWNRTTVATPTVSANALRDSLSTKSVEEGVHPRARAVLEYWFKDMYRSDSPTFVDFDHAKMWFTGGPALDKEIKEKFGDDIERVRQGEYDNWRNSPQNGLASLILMDQFTRNVFRGTKQMYSLDAKGMELARHLVATKKAKALKPIEQAFVYVPFMHHEDVESQKECVRLFKELREEVSSLENNEAILSYVVRSVEFAKSHLDVVAKYGRFPHRNRLLGRLNTEAEDLGFKEGTIPSF